jgi:hypothetical protein
MPEVKVINDAARSKKIHSFLVSLTSGMKYTAENLISQRLMITSDFQLLKKVTHHMCVALT